MISSKVIFKKLGLYNLLLGIKRNIDKKAFEQQERSNAIKRRLFYETILKPGQLIFDVGANIGNRTEIFVGLGAKVVAVEPQEDCAHVLFKKFEHKIDIEKVGLGSKEEYLDFHIADESTISTFSNDFIDKTGQSKFSRNKWGKTIKIKVTTLDNLILKYGIPDFCKIDVEGFEPEVLSGLSQPIPMLSFEYNVPDLASNVYRCIAKLNSLSDSYFFNYSIGESMKFNFVDWQSEKDFMKHVHTDVFLKSDFGDIYARLKSHNK